jgi:hypothetical protein
MSQKPEIITLSEALSRIGLGDLLPDGDRHMVGWNGYPRPFACGTTEVRGEGPFAAGVSESDNDSKGCARLYQERVRVSREVCNGNVLFSWSLYSHGIDGTFFRLNSGVAISVRETDDGHDLRLKLVFMG